MTLKRILAIVALCIVTCALWAQNEVSLVVSGEGKDKEEATLKALRSAIEQAYGTFVSANTTVLNDQLVADEIVSLSSGNIQKYEYVSEAKMPDGSTYVTLSATISIDKLVAFAESKGMEAELKGGLFAMTIKKMEFDKQAEEKAVENLCKQLEAMLPTLFDYEIEVGEPKIHVISRDASYYTGCTSYKHGDPVYLIGENKDPDYEVDFEIFVSPTENLSSFYSILANNLLEIGLSDSELEKYHSVNMPVFSFDYHFEFGYIDRAITHYNNISSNDDIIPFLSDFQAKYAEKIWRGRQIKDLNKTEILQYLISFVRKTKFRSEKSIDLINDLIDKSLFELYNFVISDDLRDFKLFVSTIGGEDRLILPNWLAVRTDEFNNHFSSEFEYTFSIETKHGEYTYYLDAKMMRDEVDGGNHWILLLDVNNYGHSYNYAFSHQFGRGFDRKYNREFHPNENNRCERGICDGLHLLKGYLFYYGKEEISKITHISVRKPTYTENNSTVPSTPTNPSNTKQPQPQSKTNLYNDTLQQAVNEYNALLKKFPYNYNENKIAFVLSSSLPDDEGFLRDTLHSLLDTISAKRARLVAQYKKDSLEFQQLNNSYQEKIDEANIQFLKYPYNLQKRTLKDSLSISLFGKTEELTKQLRTKVAALPQMQEQAEKEVYAETKKNNPQCFTEIYFAQNPTAKQKADSTFLECRCGYDCRLTFDMDFINNALPECNCREKKYQALKTLYHSREEFDQSYNQEESAFESEVTDRKKMWKEIKRMDEMLSNWKQLNTKKALSSTKTEIMDILNRVKQHQGSYYYDDAIDVIFAYDEKLSKEWDKNGSYFKSKNEMFEYWIGEEYDKVLKARKK